MTLPISINDEAFVLHCSGALFWPNKNMLLISDVHLGKVTHFRKHGVALPQHSAAGNFKQLDFAVSMFGPEKICFLGDLFHSVINSEWELFEKWVGQTDAEIVLIAGNHDIIAPERYFQIGVQVVSEWTIDSFLLTHHPEIRNGYFTFCGHIHPGVLLHGFGRQWLELKCFFRSPNQMILPAFGQFTGKFILRPGDSDLVYAITKDEVILIDN